MAYRDPDLQRIRLTELRALELKALNSYPQEKVKKIPEGELSENFKWYRVNQSNTPKKSKSKKKFTMKEGSTEWFPGRANGVRLDW